jgi:hypothetical protein
MLAACSPDSGAPRSPLDPQPSLSLSCDAAGCTGGLATDQQQPLIDDGASITFAIGGPIGQILAQTFTASSSTRLGAISVSVGCEVGTDLIVEIRELNGILPTGAVIGGTTEPGADLAGVGIPGVFSNIEVRPDRGRFIHLTPGTKYAIVLNATTGGSCGSWPGPSGDSYSDGEGWAFASADAEPVWVRTNISIGAPDDLPFRTYTK